MVRKVRLAPGESRRVAFTLGHRDFCWYDVDTHRWARSTGTARIVVGASSRDLRLAAGRGVVGTRLAWSEEAPEGTEPSEWRMCLRAIAEAAPRDPRLSVKVEDGTAEALPFADASFDVVLSTFGVMFTPDQDKAAAAAAAAAGQPIRLAGAEAGP